MKQYFRAYLAFLARRYPNEVDYTHARALLLLMSSTTLLALLTAGLHLLMVSAPGRELHYTLLSVVITALLANVAVLFLLNRGRLKWASSMLAGVFFVLGAFVILSIGLNSAASALIVMATLVVGIFFGVRGMIFSGSLSALLVLGVGQLERSGADIINPLPYNDNTILMAVVALLTLLLLTAGILGMFSGSLQGSLDRQSQMVRQLRTVSEFAQGISTMVEGDRPISELVEMIRGRLDIYHVSMYFLDEKSEEVVLAASTGDVGERLLARGHSLPVGSRSLVGQAIARDDLVYSADRHQDTIYQENRLLPEVRSEVALPIRDGEAAIGVLDVGCLQPHAFDATGIEMLELMAVQISIAMRNSRLVERLRAGKEENRRLYDQSQQSLREVERLNRLLTNAVWRDYFSNLGREPSVEVGQSGVQHEVAWTPAMAQAARQGHAVVLPRGQQTTLAVPLNIRGQILGAIEVDLPPGSSGEDALELVEAVSARLALALDNRRLFDEARSLAQQEYVINQIGGRLQQTSDLDDMLRVALMELRTVLGAESGSIRLQANALSPEQEA